MNKDYRALNEMFYRHGLVEKARDMLSLANTAAILNGTGFTLMICDTFKYYYFRGWRSLDVSKRGYYYCSKEHVLSVHVTWYFSKTTVSEEFIREFNQKWVEIHFTSGVSQTSVIRLNTSASTISDRAGWLSLPRS